MIYFIQFLPIPCTLQKNPSRLNPFCSSPVHFVPISSMKRKMPHDPTPLQVLVTLQ